jgi:serine O-acetyltransferase
MTALALARRTLAIPSWCRLLAADYRRYRAEGHSTLATVFLTQGFWASAVHRVCRALVDAMPPGIAQTLAKTLVGTLQKVVEILTGIALPRTCRIGGGLYIPRFGSIILSHGPIGANVTIEHCVTIGSSTKGGERGYPTIGDRVHIGAQSIIVGKITVGDDAVICPGSFVTRSVPPCAVVAGNPAKVVSHEGSFELISYDGMQADPDRRDALAQSGRPSGCP